METELQNEQQMMDEPIFEKVQEKKKVLTVEEKKELVLREQALNTPHDTIAEMLGTTPHGLRSFMNRQGYKSDNSIYKPKNYKEQNLPEGVKNTQSPHPEFKESETEPGKYTQISEKFLEELEEMYDFYLLNRDNKNYRAKVTKKTKEINIIDDYSDEETVMFAAKIPKSVAEDFERLTKNSLHDSRDILTQALVWYLAEYKHLV